MLMSFQYTSWISNGKLAWTLLSGGLIADNKSEIAARPIPQEPMYIIFNLGRFLQYMPRSQCLPYDLGLSTSFVTVDYDDLAFPATMNVDYVRVYQDPDNINIGCDPEDFPTADYISTCASLLARSLDSSSFHRYNEAYTNPNHTLWSDIGESFPGNSFAGEC